MDRVKIVGQGINFIKWISIFICACLLLSACGKDTHSLKKYIADVKSRPGSKIEPIPEFKPIPKHHYSSAHKRSPFTKVVINTNNAYQPDLERVKEPLESYALDSLHMVGTLSRDHIMWALVQTPDGKIQPVKVGNFLGMNHGKVTAITGDEIKLTETVRGPNGWEKRKAALVISAK